MYFHVFRIENRKSGWTDYIGDVTAPDKEQALIEAAGQYDCPESCSLYVEECWPEFNES